MPVVSREYIARSARRHDTVMAWAFRRALGVTAATRRRPGGAGGVRLEALRYGRARSVAEVSAVRSALAARRATWSSPETFVALCKALKDDRASVICPPSVPDKQPRATTSW